VFWGEGLGHRCGSPSFILYARYPRAPSLPARRRLGRYPELTLDGARRKARAWLDLIERGIDPADEDERKVREEAQRENTFDIVAREHIRQRVIGVRSYSQLSARAESYLQAHQNKKLSHLGALARVIPSSGMQVNMRKAAAVIHDIDREFVKRWGNRSINSITPRDVRQVLTAAVKRGAPYQAFNLLTHAKMLFSWVVSRDGGEHGRSHARRFVRAA
jgi:Arm domain-containing DNA-binding protein